MVRRETDDVPDRIRIKIVNTPDGCDGFPIGSTHVNVDDSSRILAVRLLSVADAFGCPERGQRAVMRLVVADHHNSAIGGGLDDPAFLRVRVLRYQRDHTPGKIRLPELRLGNRDDIPARLPDSQQDFSLRVKIFPAVKTARLSDDKNRVITSLNVRDSLAKRGLLLAFRCRVAVQLEPLDDRDSALLR